MVKRNISFKELKHHSRRLSIKEGIFSSAKESFGYRFISPFAIAINTSNAMVALLSSIAGLLGPLSQLTGSRLFKKSSRKKIVLKTTFIEALMWLPFIAIAILFYKGISISFLPLFLMIAFSAYTIMSNLHYPLWFSWMGDIVDGKYRGRWFSKRNLITGFVAVILAILASLFLDYFEKINLTMIGFVILFSLALIARLFSFATFRKQYEPKLKFEKKDDFSFIEFLKKAPKNNFGKFTIFRSLISFTVAISGSILAIYLLRHLGFNYSTYMAIILSEVLFSLIVMEFWGRFADKYGNYRLLSISSMIIPLIPILWILSPSPIYLIFVPALISGTVSAGFMLASGNFIYDNVSKEKRSIAVSYHNMLRGIGIFLGAAIAAILIKYLQIDLIKPIIFIFLISSLARLIVISFFFRKVREVRKTKHFDPNTFRKSLIKQIKPTMREEIHEIASIKGYLKE